MLDEINEKIKGANQIIEGFKKFEDIKSIDERNLIQRQALLFMFANVKDYENLAQELIVQ